MSNETTAILSLAADRFLNHRHAKVRDVFAAIGRGEDPRVPARVMAVRDGFLFDVELPFPDIHEGATYVACILQAEHVIGLQEHLDIPARSEDHHLVVPSADDIGVRLWAGESWIDGRTEFFRSERYTSFPRSVRLIPEPVLASEAATQFIDPVQAYEPLDIPFSRAREHLHKNGCVVTHVDLDRELDRFLDDLGIGIERDFGPDPESPFGPSSE